MTNSNLNFIRNTDLKVLDEMHRAARDKKVADRIKAVILLNKGWSATDISEALLLNERTIYRYREAYKSGGVDALWQVNYRGSPSKLTEDQQKELITELRNKFYPDTKEICDFVKRRFKVYYTPNGIVPLLHRLGFSYKKTKAMPAKVDPEKQNAFLKEYKHLKAHLKKGENVYFGDAVHPTYNMKPDYAWLPKGEDVFVQSNSGRQRLNLFGVYSPVDGSRIVRDFVTINQFSVIAMLKAIERANKNASTIYLFLDNARCHHGREVKKYLKTSRIKILYLPPYSPNLNLIERLWRLLKRKVLANNYFESFDEFKSACLCFLRKDTKRFHAMLDTLMAENFQMFPSE